MEDFELGAVENYLDRLEPIFKRGKERVAFELTFDQSKIKVGAERQSLFVNLSASADKIVQWRIHRAKFQKVLYNAQVGGVHAANLGELELVWGRGCRLASGNPRLGKYIREPPLQNPRPPTQHNVDAIGQWFSQTLEGFSPDDDDMAGGHFLEPLEILRQMPRDFTTGSDYAVERHGGDGFEVVGVQALACQFVRDL